MNKRNAIGLAACTVAAMLFASAAPAQQVIKLTLADQNANTAWGSTHAMQPWIKKVEAATKGRVKIELYASQTLTKGPDTWNAVKSGVADIGWCFHGYWPELTPLSDVVTLPSLPFTKAEKGSEVLWKLYEKFPAVQREYRDVQPLMLWTSNPYILVTTKKQVKTLEDLKGMKIRVTGGPPTAQMRALGAVPTLIPMPDNYMALDKGTIDGMGAPWEAIHGFRLYEVLRNYTMVPLSAVYFSMSMNKQKWESLPKDVREAIMSVSGLEGSKFFGKNFFDEAESGVLERVKAGKHTLNRYVPPPQELERWRKVAGEPLWNEWVKTMQSKGRPEAQQVLDTTLQMLKN
jgi:TRAP-type C4-dicarboxylate transport system substrate-binding protein